MKNEKGKKAAGCRVAPRQGENYELRITNSSAVVCLSLTLVPLTLNLIQPPNPTEEAPITNNHSTIQPINNSTFPGHRSAQRKGKRKNEKRKRIRRKAAGCRVAPRQRSCIEAPGGHSPIAPETGASIRPDESGLLGNRLLPAGPQTAKLKEPSFEGATGGKHRNKPPKLLISRHYFAPLTLNPYTLNPFPGHRAPPKKHRISNNHSTIQQFNQSTI